MTTLLTSAGSSIIQAVAGLSLSGSDKIRDFAISVNRTSTGSSPGEGVLAAVIMAADSPLKTVRTGTGSSVSNATNNLALSSTERIERIYIGHACNILGSAIGVEVAALIDSSKTY